MSRLGNVIRDGDIVSGALLAGLGTYIISKASTWDYMTTNGPGPGFFPLWYGICIVVLSLGLIGCALFKGIGAAHEPIDWRGVGRALVTWLAFVIATALMPYLGFVVALALLCLCLIRVVFRQPLIRAIVASVAITAAFKIIFVMLLQLDLPIGALGI
ncbi:MULTISPECIES: tripartite tricarboxylate transporter TctB family protein [unclassified Chelatococcus]|uniref:tripartite tricarboxylate transporter TctB family protein n=1 Tax=unclassified Chelatococcus TaxID=2638111 RepID=UPI001BCB9D78|nr:MULTISPECIES: tripartite tricarboxylate transporter TctB family protein [unclassified Chelatococcus]MBS7697226.1 tripartite tricarboxylate transporter TctB family protein [Chelatococcus sp. YT9]MBX3556477.1 tripartite tricarboxylate transporter TctB family protein [Chelatococcus sp.]